MMSKPALRSAAPDTNDCRPLLLSSADWPSLCNLSPAVSKMASVPSSLTLSFKIISCGIAVNLLHPSYYVRTAHSEAQLANDRQNKEVLRSFYTADISTKPTKPRHA